MVVYIFKCFLKYICFLKIIKLIFFSVFNDFNTMKLKIKNKKYYFNKFLKDTLKKINELPLRTLTEFSHLICGTDMLEFVPGGFVTTRLFHCLSPLSCLYGKKHS